MPPCKCPSSIVLLRRYLSQDEVDGPRPESYFEDFELASGLNEEDRTRLYTEMKVLFRIRSRCTKNVQMEILCACPSFARVTPSLQSITIDLN